MTWMAHLQEKDGICLLLFNFYRFVVGGVIECVRNDVQVYNMCANDFEKEWIKLYKLFKSIIFQHKLG